MHSTGKSVIFSHICLETGSRLLQLTTGGNDALFSFAGSFYPYARALNVYQRRGKYCPILSNNSGERGLTSQLGETLIVFRPHLWGRTMHLDHSIRQRPFWDKFQFVTFRCAQKSKCRPFFFVTQILFPQTKTFSPRNKRIVPWLWFW